MYFDNTNSWGWNSWLQVNQAAAGNDYYIETELDFSGFTDIAFIVALACRVNPNAQNGTDVETGGLAWQCNFEMDDPGAGQVTINFYSFWDADDIEQLAGCTCTITDNYSLGGGSYTLPGTPTGCVLRMEVEGTDMRLFVDGVMLASSSFVQTLTSLETAKLSGIAINTFGYDNLYFNYLKGGDSLIGYLPGAGGNGGNDGSGGLLMSL
jgi:hypothetical protein